MVLTIVFVSEYRGRLSPPGGVEGLRQRLTHSWACVSEELVRQTGVQAARALGGP